MRFILISTLWPKTTSESEILVIEIECPFLAYQINRTQQKRRFKICSLCLLRKWLAKIELRAIGLCNSVVQTAAHLFHAISYCLAGIRTLRSLDPHRFYCGNGWGNCVIFQTLLQGVGEEVWVIYVNIRVRMCAIMIVERDCVWCSSESVVRS